MPLTPSVITHTNEHVPKVLWFLREVLLTVGQVTELTCSGSQEDSFTVVIHPISNLCPYSLE